MAKWRAGGQKYPGSVTQGKEALRRGGGSTPLQSQALFFFKAEGWKVKRVCACMCSHMFCFFSLFFAPVETKKVAQRLIQFRTTATPTPLWLIKWENVIVNFVGICIYIAAAVPVVTALKIWVPIPGLPSLTSGTSHVTESGIHVHIPSLNVAQCWRMWKSNMTSSIIL